MSFLNEKISVKQIVFFSIVGAAALFYVILKDQPSAQNVPTPSPIAAQPHVEANVADKKLPPDDPFSPDYKPESKKEYKSSCKSVVRIDDGKNIYIKDFLKNPARFAGQRLNLQAKIMSIEESGDRTFMQVYVSQNYFDSAIVLFDGTMKIYEGDIIRVYGEAGGTYEGQNRMGAAMSWPVVHAKYITKERSGE